MPLSARNRLPGVVQEVHLGTIMARVVIKVGDNMVESVITRASAEELGLKLWRAESFYDSPTLTQALADIVRSTSATTSSQDEPVAQKAI